MAHSPDAEAVALLCRCCSLLLCNGSTEYVAAATDGRSGGSNAHLFADAHVATCLLANGEPPVRTLPEF